VNEELAEKVKKACSDKIYAIARSASDKMTRKKAFDKVAEEFVAQLEAEMGETYESAVGAEAGKLLFAELENLMQDEKNFQEYYDDSYTTLVNKGVKFYASDITGLKWVEIDTHDDFARAQEIFKN
jgi:choline kinase